VSKKDRVERDTVGHLTSATTTKGSHLSCQHSDDKKEKMAWAMISASCLLIDGNRLLIDSLV
jgi:hypothetical protein